MNSDAQRSTTLIALLGVGLLAALGWSFFDRLRADDRLDAEQRKLVDCVQISAKIKDLRPRKQRALLRSKPTDELNQRIDSWAPEAGISPKNLIRIQPRSPSRVRDSQYLRQVTELEFFEVTLAKIIRFCQIAEQAGDGLKLSSFRVSPPRALQATDEPEAEWWVAELELTYLIYSPKSG